MIIRVIQLDKNEITCVFFSKNRSGLELLRGFQSRFENDEELLSVLQSQALYAKEETRTVLALPPSLLSLRELQLPFKERKKIRAVLPLELAGEIALGDTEIACDAIPLANGNLLAGWVKLETVKEFIAIFSKAGIEPEIITVACLNWHRLAKDNKNDQISLFFDKSAMLAVKDGMPAYCRIFDLEMEPSLFEQTLAASELLLGAGFSKFYRLGTETEPVIKDAVIPSVTGIISDFSVDSDLPTEALLSPVAIALSFDDEEIFNIRNGSIAWTGRASQLLSSFRLPLILAAIIILLLFARLGIRYYQIDSELKDINSAISGIYKKAFPGRKKAVDETAEMKAEIKKLDGGIHSSQTLIFMDQLAKAMGAGIAGISEIDFDGEQFLLKGNGRSYSDITEFVRQLSAKGWIIAPPDLVTRPDGTVLFTLRGKSGGSTK